LPDEVAEESIDLMSLYTNLLIPGALALCDIESHGVAIDRQFYVDTWRVIQERAEPLLAHIREVTGIEEFNPNSPQQVRKLIYETMGMPFGQREAAMFARSKDIKNFASGPRRGVGEGAEQMEKRYDVTHTARRGKLREGPTAKVVLKQLHKRFPELDPHNVIPDILEYRNLTKTAGTYVKGMLERADDDDRIRGDFLEHGTSTGRLSSANPNLQNIPETSHTKIEIRNGFVAPPGFVLLNADYSQLELRLAAHLSNDTNFCRVFIEGRDPHQEVAYAFFQKPEDQVSAYERYMAKCVNFGVAYGRGAESIALGPEMEYVEEIGGQRWTVEQVKEFFTAYFDHFPEFLAWCEEQKRFAYRHQYVESPLGRRRRFPLILRNDAGSVGRQAVNTPIQGTASDFTFSALIRIHRRLCEINDMVGRVVAFIVSTVHDSLLIECHKRYVKKVSAIVYEEMERVPIASPVPFECEVKVGTRWGDLHKIDKEEDVAIATASEE
jgi:DNA polymerase-1